MSDVLTFETTKAFCAQFKEVKTLARAGAVIELHEGTEVFIFQRKPGTGGFFGAMRGQVSSRAATDQLLSSGATWEPQPLHAAHQTTLLMPHLGQ